MPLPSLKTIVNRTLACNPCITLHCTTNKEHRRCRLRWVTKNHFSVVANLFSFLISYLRMCFAPAMQDTHFCRVSRSATLERNLAIGGAASATWWYCVETNEPRIMRFLPTSNHRDYNFLDQLSYPNSQGLLSLTLTLEILRWENFS